MQLLLQSTWYSELVIFCLLMFPYHFQPQIFCSYFMRINISAKIVKEIDDQMDFFFLILWENRYIPKIMGPFGQYYKIPFQGKSSLHYH